MVKNMKATYNKKFGRLNIIDESNCNNAGQIMCNIQVNETVDGNVVIRIYKDDWYMGYITVSEYEVI